MRKILCLTPLFALVLSSSVWAADVSGTWALKMAGPQGDENFDVVIKAAGENLTVSTANHPMLQAMEGTGTLKGDAINFSLKATGQMAIEIAFTGKVTGDKMAGTREIKMSGGGGGAPGGGDQQAAGGRQGGGAPGGGEQAAGGARGGGEAPAGGQAPAGGGQQGGGGAPGGQAGGGGTPGGGGGGMDMSSISNEWSAVKK